MIKRVALSVLFLLSTNTMAEMVECTFTEPFLTIKINTEKGTGEFIDAVEGITIPLENLSTIGDTKGIYKVDLQQVYNQPMTLIMDLNNAGSDGMSDTWYPMDSTLLDFEAIPWIKGGCESDKKPSRCDGAGC